MYNATYARNGKFDNSSISEEEPDDDIGNTHFELDEFGQNGYDDTNGQCSTALSKLQIRLNDVINRHKAPLLLYDEIVHLINGYISSDNFSKYGKLKTRQSFIRHMEMTHPSVTALRPVNKQVTLNDGTWVEFVLEKTCTHDGLGLFSTICASFKDDAMSPPPQVSVVWQLKAYETVLD